MTYGMIHRLHIHNEYGGQEGWYSGCLPKRQHLAEKEDLIKFLKMRSCKGLLNIVDRFCFFV